MTYLNERNSTAAAKLGEYRAIGGMVGGCAGTGSRGWSRDPRLAEELLGCPYASE